MLQCKGNTDCLWKEFCKRILQNKELLGEPIHQGNIINEIGMYLNTYNLFRINNE